MSNKRPEHSAPPELVSYNKFKKYLSINTMYHKVL
jgi:hypothetical protein